MDDVIQKVKQLMEPFGWRVEYHPPGDNGRFHGFRFKLVYTTGGEKKVLGATYNFSAAEEQHWTPSLRAAMPRIIADCITRDAFDALG